MFIARPHVMLLLRNQPPHLLNNVKLNSSSTIVTVNIYWSLQKFSRKGCVLCGLTSCLQKGNQQLNNWTGEYLVPVPKQSKDCFFELMWIRGLQSLKRNHGTSEILHNQASKVQSTSLFPKDVHFTILCKSFMKRAQSAFSIIHVKIKPVQHFFFFLKPVIPSICKHSSTMTVWLILKGGCYTQYSLCTCF